MKKRIHDRKKSPDDIYLIILLVAYNLTFVDVDVFGMSLKVLILLFGSVAVIFCHTMKQPMGGNTRKQTHMDIAICCIGGCSFLGLIYQLIVNPLDCEDSVKALTLCIVYYALRQCRVTVMEEMVLLFSITSTIICVMMLWHFFVNPNVSLPIGVLLQDNAILSWLIPMITINVTGYCIYKGKRVWYGSNAMVGFLLLFIQKNVIAIGIVILLCLMLPIVYAPTKALVQCAMQMLFSCTFLLCNMSLITEYTGLIKIEVSYDLEVSIYMELVLAVFGIFFFHYWDRYTAKEDADSKLLPELKEFMKKTCVVAGILVSVFLTAVIKGSTAIVSQAGSVEMVSLPIYMIFILAFLKDTNGYEKKMRGEDTNEINYSDSVL